MRFHEVEINFPDHIGPDFMLKLDGVELKAVCGVVIKSAFASGHSVPTIQITLLASRITGKVKGKVESILINPLPLSGEEIKEAADDQA